jgi:hypothetical protein
LLQKPVSHISAQNEKRVTLEYTDKDWDRLIDVITTHRFANPSPIAFHVSVHFAGPLLNTLSGSHDGIEVATDASLGDVRLARRLGRRPIKHSIGSRQGFFWTQGTNM